MSRPLSWLPRIHEIRRAVANSVRTHYDRGDIERLFEFQPRAAQKMLELLPVIKIGTSMLVHREVLAEFLKGVCECDDVTSFIDGVRDQKKRHIPRKVRSIVRHDVEPASLSSLPPSINLSRGRMEISFDSVEKLAESMYILARILESEGDEFASVYEPKRPAPDQTESMELRRMFAELDAARTTV